MKITQKWSLMTAALLLALAMVAGCGPRNSPSLDAAEQAYRQAKDDASVAANASAALDDAAQSLAEARRALAAGRDMGVVDQHAYLAEQKVAIARATAEREEAEKATQALNDQRQNVLVQARTREAAQAQARVQQLQVELENAKRTDRGLVLTLGDVLFETGRADLKPGAMKNLYNLVTFLREHPDRNVVIEGHTDDVGSDAYNVQLSQQRAEAVRAFLATNGVNAARIQARGLGETLPIAGNDSEAGRQQNRRVEVVVLDAGRDGSADAARPPSGMQGTVTIPIR